MENKDSAQLFYTGFVQWGTFLLCECTLSFAVKSFLTFTCRSEGHPISNL